MCKHVMATRLLIDFLYLSEHCLFQYRISKIQSTVNWEQIMSVNYLFEKTTTSQGVHTS